MGDLALPKRTSEGHSGTSLAVFSPFGAVLSVCIQKRGGIGLRGQGMVTRISAGHRGSKAVDRRLVEVPNQKTMDHCIAKIWKFENTDWLL